MLGVSVDMRQFFASLWNFREIHLMAQCFEQSADIDGARATVGDKQTAYVSTNAIYQHSDVSACVSGDCYP